MDQLELSLSNVLSILNLFFHYLEIYLSISLSLQHIIYFNRLQSGKVSWSSKGLCDAAILMYKKRPRTPEYVLSKKAKASPPGRGPGHFWSSSSTLHQQHLRGLQNLPQVNRLQSGKISWSSNGLSDAVQSSRTKEAPDSNVRSLQKAKASPRGRGPGQTGKNLGRGLGKTGENFMSEIDRSIRTFYITCSFIS